MSDLDTNRVEQASRGSDRLFYPIFALAMAITVLFGFSFTYFIPLTSGEYPRQAPFLHVHGWSYFIWYALFLVQTILIASGRTSLHMLLGKLSIALAVVMTVTGFFVLFVRMDDAMQGGGDGFMDLLRFVGALMFSEMLLFAAFYAAAIVKAIKGKFDEHKRLMVVTSSVGLAAALSRDFIVIFGGALWTGPGGFIATNLFIVAAMIYDRLTYGQVHRIYWICLSLALGTELMLSPFEGNYIVAALHQAMATAGEFLRPFYIY